MMTIALAHEMRSEIRERTATSLSRNYTTCFVNFRPTWEDA